MAYQTISGHLMLYWISNNSVWYKYFLNFFYTQLNLKQFSLAEVQFNSIWHIDRTQSSATTPDQSGPGSDVKEGVLDFP